MRASVLVCMRLPGQCKPYTRRDIMSMDTRVPLMQSLEAAVSCSPPPSERPPNDFASATMHSGVAILTWVVRNPQREVTEEQTHMRHCWADHPVPAIEHSSFCSLVRKLISGQFVAGGLYPRGRSSFSPATLRRIALGCLRPELAARRILRVGGNSGRDGLGRTRVGRRREC